MCCSYTAPSYFASCRIWVNPSMSWCTPEPSTDSHGNTTDGMLTRRSSDFLIIICGHSPLPLPSLLAWIEGRRLALALAPCPHCWHYESMGIQISIRDVPERVRDELAARAALQGKSMQEFLRAELERLAGRPSLEVWLEQVRKRKRASESRVSADQILNVKSTDRR